VKKLDLKGLLKDRIVQVLLFVIIVNVITFVLLWRLDIFVNDDLYDFGLVFSFDWAGDYWYHTGLLWGLLVGSTALSVLSIIPHWQYSQKPNKSSKILGFLLPTLAVVYLGLCVWSLTQVNSIVQNRLYDYGLAASFNWATTYNSISASALALLVTALIALLVPAIRILEIIKIEIETEN
jgi:hypothetical protein